MGRPFCEKCLILVKCPRDSRKKSDWFCCKKISQKLKYLNFKCEQSERYFRPVLFVSPLCSCPMRKIPLATSKKSEWKSGLKSVPWTLAEFYYNRGLQRPHIRTCTILQETINRFLCPLIVFLKSKTHQLNLKDVIELNRNLRIKLLLSGMNARQYN